jgi:hypothetical protein
MAECFPFLPPVLEYMAVTARFLLNKIIYLGNITNSPQPTTTPFSVVIKPKSPSHSGLELFTSALAIQLALALASI